MQEEAGYRFDKDHALIGEMTQFNIWSKVLKPNEITAFSESCGSMSGGDVITWCNVKSMVFGNLKLLSPSLCPNNKDGRL